ncbi:putative membrane protein [Bacilli bacterium PM5-9]|nr:putative membrane protein [Bacilli bacterium PM5-9]
MKKTRELAFGSMIMAIILLMAAVPQLGYLKINLVDVTIIHIPVLVGAMTFKNRNLALISGTTFGISSWLVAMFRPLTPVDMLFQNPLVSIVPRILFALLAYWLYKFLSEKLKNDYTAKLLSVIISTIFHTTLVIAMMYIFGQNIFTGGFIALLIGVVTVNGWIEIALAAVVCPIIISALQRTIKMS